MRKVETQIIESAADIMNLHLLGIIKDVRIDNERMEITINQRLFDALYADHPKLHTEYREFSTFDRHYMTVIIDDAPQELRIMSSGLYERCEDAED